VDLLAGKFWPEEERGNGGWTRVVLGKFEGVK